MNTITRRLVVTVAAFAFAGPAVAQAQHSSIDDMARAAERMAHEAAKMVHASGWAPKTWAESWQAKQGPETTERITRTFKVGPNGSLDIGAISGDVIVSEGGG